MLGVYSRFKHVNRDYTITCACWFNGTPHVALIAPVLCPPPHRPPQRLKRTIQRIGKGFPLLTPLCLTLQINFPPVVVHSAFCVIGWWMVVNPREKVYMPLPRKQHCIAKCFKQSLKTRIQLLPQQLPSEYIIFNVVDNFSSCQIVFFLWFPSNISVWKINRASHLVWNSPWIAVDTHLRLYNGRNGLDVHTRWKYLCTIMNSRLCCSWQQSVVCNGPSIVYLKWLVRFISWFLMTL